MTNKFIDCKIIERNIQIGIAIIRKLDDGKTIEEKANEIYNYWGIGFKDCQCGIFLLISIKDRKLRINTGKDTRNIIKDNIASKIIDNMKPYLTRSDYHGAVLKFINVF